MLLDGPENLKYRTNYRRFLTQNTYFNNIFGIESENLISEIKSRFRLMFLKDYIFSVSLSEELVNELSCVQLLLY